MFSINSSLHLFNLFQIILGHLTCVLPMNESISVSEYGTTSIR